MLKEIEVQYNIKFKLMYKVVYIDEKYDQKISTVTFFLMRMTHIVHANTNKNFIMKVMF